MNGKAVFGANFVGKAVQHCGDSRTGSKTGTRINRGDSWDTVLWGGGGRGCGNCSCKKT
jgi:hypothetical protein